MLPDVKDGSEEVDPPEPAVRSLLHSHGQPARRWRVCSANLVR